MTTIVSKLVHTISCGDFNLMCAYAHDEDGLKAIQSPDRERPSLLHHAVSCGDSKIVSYLLKLDAPVDFRDADGYTPLFWAIFAKKIEIVKLLLENGANPNFLTSQNETPLMFAAQNDFKEAVETLLDCENVRIGDFDAVHNNALHYAAMNGNTALLIFLIEKYNGDEWMEGKNFDGQTPICILQNKVDMEKDIERSRVYAVLSEMLKKRIQEMGQEEEASRMREEDDYQIFHIAATYYPFVYECLVEHEIDIDVEAVLGLTPMHLLAENNHGQTIENLMPRVADINRMSEQSGTPLHCAARFGSLKALRVLLENGADVNSKCNDGFTALEIACRENQYEAAKMLLKFGATFNHFNWEDSGFTAFHWAAVHPMRHNLLQLFIEKDKTLLFEKDGNDETALDVAIENDNQEAIELLEMMGVSYKNDEEEESEGQQKKRKLN